MDYFLVINNERVGPVPENQLLASGLKPETLVWCEGMPNWLAASKVELLQALFPPVPTGGFSQGPPPIPSPPPELPLSAPAPQTPPRAERPNNIPSANAPWQPYPQGPPDSPRTFHILYLWYVGLIGAGLLVTVVFIATMIALDISRSHRTMDLVVGVYLFTLAGLVISIFVLNSILLYKMWSQIQDGFAKLSPGLAVGLCYVPVFHLIWYFFAYFGLSKDQNIFIYRHRIPARPNSEAMALTTCILNVIPYVNFIAILILMPITMLFLKNTAMDIARARSGQT